MSTHPLIIKIVSGGQTGVDRAALDVAIELGLEHGGWCPRGRRAEDGPIGPRYELRETESPAYAVRTEWNVRDSDATLVLCRGKPRGGTRLTCRFAEQYPRPLLVVDLAPAPKPTVVRRWLTSNVVQILNVAGPRESQSPGIGGEAFEFLKTLLAGRSRR